jgi:hypothetical protein
LEKRKPKLNYIQQGFITIIKSNLSNTSCNILLELAHDRLHTTLIHNKSKAERVGVVESGRPRGNDTTVDGVILELHQLYDLLSGNLLKCVQLISDGGGETGQADDAGVGEEFGGGDVLGNDEVLDGGFGAG